eukprot:CCRYP_001941-RA/>CCRYP_001941-RA protein AED:0.46 eAED:0.46 QI:0/0/0/1/0/0/2/0/117
MYTSTFHNRKKCSKGTCVARAKVYAPPRQLLAPTSLATPSHTQQGIDIKMYDTHDTVYFDQTGKFPLTSSRGNQYQMILYHTDSNSIWVELTKNRTEGELILADNQALTQMRASPGS